MRAYPCAVRVGIAQAAADLRAHTLRPGRVTTASDELGYATPKHAPGCASAQKTYGRQQCCEQASSRHQKAVITFARYPGASSQPCDKKTGDFALALLVRKPSRIPAGRGLLVGLLSDMQLLIALSVCTLFAITDVRAAFNLQQAYSGSSFFTGWDFSGGFDSTTLGIVQPSQPHFICLKSGCSYIC